MCNARFRIGRMYHIGENVHYIRPGNYEYAGIHELNGNKEFIFIKRFGYEGAVGFSILERAFADSIKPV
jgi:hypothetical protein